MGVESTGRNLYLERLESDSLQGPDYWQNEYEQSFRDAEESLNLFLNRSAFSEDRKQSILQSFHEYENDLRDELLLKSRLTDLDLEAFCVNLLNLPKQIFLDSYNSFLKEEVSQESFDVEDVKLIILNQYKLRDNVLIFQLNSLIINNLVEFNKIDLLFQARLCGIDYDLNQFGNLHFFFRNTYEGHKLMSKPFFGYPKLVKFIHENRVDSSEEFFFEGFEYSLSEFNNANLFIDFLKRKLSSDEVYVSDNSDFEYYYNLKLAGKPDLVASLVEYNPVGSPVISRYAQIIQMAESNLSREQLDSLYRDIDSVDFQRLILSFSFELTAEFLSRETFSMSSENLNTDLEATIKSIEYLFWYGWQNNLLKYNMLSFVDRFVPELSLEAFNRKQSLYRPVFRDQEGMNLEGGLPSFLRPQHGTNDVYRLEFELEDGSKVSGYELLKGDTSFESLPQVLQDEINSYMQSNNVARYVARKNIKLRYREYLSEGDGTSMNNLYAFHRSALAISRSGSLRNKTRLTLTYPGIGSHMSSLELISTILNENSNINEVDFNITEWKDTRSEILQLLIHLSNNNPAISDLPTEWSDFSVDYSLASSESFVSNLSFKLNGKIINLRFFYRAFEATPENHWSGSQNILDSDIIIIHDLEAGMGNKHNAPALRSVVRNVKDSGLSKIVMVNFQSFQDEQSEGLFDGMNIRILEYGIGEQYGCSCYQTAKDGMVVLEISRRDSVSRN